MNQRLFRVAILAGGVLLSACSAEAAAQYQYPAPVPSPYKVETKPDSAPRLEAEADTPQWDEVYQGRTIRQWYNRARDKKLFKSERDLAFVQLYKAGEAGWMALYELLSAADKDTVIPIDSKAWDPHAVPAGYTRRQAARMFCLVGPQAQAAAPKLAEIMLTDPSGEVRQTAAQALAMIGARDSGVRNKLKETLKRGDVHVWASAIQALTKTGPLDQETIKLLETLVNADPGRLVENDLEWSAVMNARQAARAALMRR